MIRTVRGDISTDRLGVTMCHEHLFLDLSRVRGNDDSTFSDVDEILKEVAPLKKLGCDSVVEVTTIDMGRNVLKLRDISRLADINIIASTGYYTHAYHPASLEAETVNRIAARFVGDIKDGIDDTGIKAGVIAEVASGKTMHPREEKVLRAAASASAQLGCAVSTHTNRGALAIEQAELMLGEGMRADKLIIGHLDLLNDVEELSRVLEKGVNIGFDTIGKVNYLADEVKADNLLELARRGYSGQIVLSQDISRRSYFISKGKSGYTAVLGGFVGLLQSKGAKDNLIRSLLVDNPARIFDFDTGVIG